MMADLAERGAVDARTGALRPQALRKWSERNAANLDLVPGLRDEVNGLITRAQKGEVVSGRFAEELRNAQTNLKMTERQINSGALGNIMGAGSCSRCRLDLQEQQPGRRNGPGSQRD
jgi:hypothetical protein